MKINLNLFLEHNITQHQVYDEDNHGFVYVEIWKGVPNKHEQYLRRYAKHFYSYGIAFFDTHWGFCHP